MWLQGVTGSYRRLQRVTGSYLGLEGVEGAYKRLQGVADGYKGLHGPTRGGGPYNWLQGLTRDYICLQRITVSCKG